MAKSRTTRIVTKKHLARVERERIQRRHILLASMVVFVLVVGLIVFGILQQTIIQPRQPVAIVDGEAISTREFQGFARYQRRQLVQQYIATYQNMQFFADDANTQAFFQQNLRQIQFQLEPTALGQEVINGLVEDRLIRAEAERRGIIVKPEEVDELIQQAFGYYPGGEAATPTAAPTTIPTSTLSPTQLALIPPTATPTEEETPSPQATSEVDLTPSPEFEPEAIATPAEPEGPAPTPVPEPTATPYTFEAFQQDYNVVLEGLKQEINIGQADLRSFFESQLYRQKLMEAMTADVSWTQEQVWARHILVEDENTAREVLGRLEDGDEFAELASQYSLDESNKERGGDLDWFPLGLMAPEFEKTAFETKIGDISQPVQTQFGWHIIQVLGHEDRPLSPAEYEQLRQADFQDWLTQQRLFADVEMFDYWVDRVPTQPTIPPAIQQP